MHESNGHAALPYAAGNALDRVVANVTYTKYYRASVRARKRSLEYEVVTAEKPLEDE
jgi:hypothetical protein